MRTSATLCLVVALLAATALANQTVATQVIYVRVLSALSTLGAETITVGFGADGLPPSAVSLPVVPLYAGTPTAPGGAPYTALTVPTNLAAQLFLALYLGNGLEFSNEVSSGGTYTALILPEIVTALPRNPTVRLFDDGAAFLAARSGRTASAWVRAVCACLAPDANVPQAALPLVQLGLGALSLNYSTGMPTAGVITDYVPLTNKAPLCATLYPHGTANLTEPVPGIPSCSSHQSQTSSTAVIDFRSVSQTASTLQHAAGQAASFTLYTVCDLALQPQLVLVADGRTNLQLAGADKASRDGSQVVLSRGELALIIIVAGLGCAGLSVFALVLVLRARIFVLTETRRQDYSALPGTGVQI